MKRIKLISILFLFLFFYCDNKESADRQAKLNEEFLEAISNNDLEEAVEKLEAGADINAVDDFRRSALIHASVNNDLNLAEYLVTVPGILLDSEDYSGKTAFVYASINNNPDMLKLLINAGADINAESDGGNALVRAVENNKIETIKLLINSGADLDSRNAYGLTPVMIAVEKDNMEILQFLLDNGADANTGVSDTRIFLEDWPEGAKAINNARLKGSKEIIELLLEAGAENYLVINPELNKELFANAETFNNEKVKVLLNDGADVNAFNEIGMTPLMIAVEDGNYELAEMLIARGADVNASVPIKHEYWGRGTTALIIASNKGFTEIVNLLLKAGADIKAKEYYGNTALMEAKNNGHADIYNILLNLENSMEEAKQGLK